MPCGIYLHVASVLKLQFCIFIFVVLLLISVFVTVIFVCLSVCHGPVREIKAWIK